MCCDFIIYFAICNLQLQLTVLLTLASGLLILALAYDFQILTTVLLVLDQQFVFKVTVLLILALTYV